MGTPATFHSDEVEDLRTALANRNASLSEIVSIRNQAKALQNDLRRLSCDLSARNSVVELILRAERKAGRILANMHLRGGGRDRGKRLKAMGIDRNMSARWQKTAAVTRPTFEASIRSTEMV